MENKTVGHICFIIGFICAVIIFAIGYFLLLKTTFINIGFVKMISIVILGVLSLINGYYVSMYIVKYLERKYPYLNKPTQ